MEIAELFKTERIGYNDFLDRIIGMMKDYDYSFSESILADMEGFMLEVDSIETAREYFNINRVPSTESLKCMKILLGKKPDYHLDDVDYYDEDD